MQGLVFGRLKNKYFTYMKEIMDVASDHISKYNWLISDYICNVYPSECIDPKKELAWIDGESLISLVNENDIQFIWAVFSAFPKSVTLQDVLKYRLPFADGNEAIRDVDIKMQNPLAEIEIIPWDSCLLVIIAQSSNLIRRLKKEYPDAIDLKTYNSSIQK